MSLGSWSLPSHDTELNSHSTSLWPAFLHPCFSCDVFENIYNILQSPVQDSLPYQRNALNCVCVLCNGFKGSVDWGTNISKTRQALPTTHVFVLFCLFSASAGSHLGFCSPEFQRRQTSWVKACYFTSKMGALRGGVGWFLILS